MDVDGLPDDSEVANGDVSAGSTEWMSSLRLPMTRVLGNSIQLVVTEARCWWMYLHAGVLHRPPKGAELGEKTQDKTVGMYSCMAVIAGVQ